jgi:uncharacterized protein (TIGR02246 family)
MSARSFAPLLLPLALVATLAACSEQPKAHGDAAHEDRTVVVQAISSPPTKKEIAALFDDWNDTLRNGGPHDMALLYAEDGVLLPTVSNQVRSNRVEVADYFEHFLQLHPRGVINEQHIDVLDANTAVNSGVYTFDVVKEGQPTFVVARYSFLYEKVGGKWLIKSHHSSAMPESITARPAALVASVEPVAVASIAPAAPPEAGHDDLKPTSGGHGATSHGSSSHH